MQQQKRSIIFKQGFFHPEKKKKTQITLQNASGASGMGRQTKSGNRRLQYKPVPEEPNNIQTVSGRAP